MKSRIAILLLALGLTALCAFLTSIIWKQEDKLQNLKQDDQVTKDYSEFQDWIITGNYNDAFVHYNEKTSFDYNPDFSKQVAFNALRQFWLVIGSRKPSTTDTLSNEKIDLTGFDELPATSLKSVLEFDSQDKKLLSPVSLFHALNNCNMTTKTLIDSYELVISTSPGYEAKYGFYNYGKAYELSPEIWDHLTSITRIQALAMNRKWPEIVRDFKYVESLNKFEPGQDRLYWLYARALHAENQTTTALQLRRKLEQAKIPIPQGYQEFFTDQLK